MSVVLNDSQQLSLTDPCFNLTDREKRIFGKSWATYFGDYIFPKINEERFAVLFSDNKASRPATPINVVVGALFLKDMRQQSDDDILESILFDVRYQYALHTTSMEEQPISDRTLSRFRARCYEYELKTGIDLIMEENKALAADMAVMMKIDGTLKRMDSMMVASSIKNLSRLELLYTCLANLVNEMNDRKASLPENLIHYTDKDDRNQFIYHNKSDETEEKITKVLTDCSTALLLCDDSYAESVNYCMFQRVLSEQTVCEDGVYRLRTRKDGGMNGDMLQNPADPDATYREKAGQGYKGYSANLVESVGDGCSLITDYAFQPNTHSDSEFAKETIEGMGKQEQKTTIVADGAFGGAENIDLAKANNIDLVTTNLLGKTPEDIQADFEFSEDGKKVVRCPGGCEPKSCWYNEKTGQCVVSFKKEQCEKCPYFQKCHPEERKRTCKKTVSAKGKARALQVRFRSTEEFSRLTKIRNGVETVPSSLRRAHKVDHMPVRGLIRCRQWFGLAIAGSNIKKFCSKCMQGLFSKPQNVVTA